MFIVDDILLAQIVLPYGQRLLDQGRDKLYAWVNQQLGKESKKLVKGWRKRNPPEQEVLRELGCFAEQHPEAAGRLTSAALAAEVDAADKTVFGAANELLTADQRDEKFLRAVRDYFLAPIVDMVQALGRPVILPGFLTGTGYLTAIDVRTPFGTQLTMPTVRGRSKEHAPDLMFSGPLAPVSVIWSPRLWLVEAKDEHRQTYEDLARKPGTTLKEFADAMQDQRLVTAITRTHVVVRRAETPTEQIPPVPHGDSQTIPLVKSPAEIETMRAALAGQLGERLGEDRLWIRALAGIAGSGPNGAASS